MNKIQNFKQKMVSCHRIFEFTPSLFLNPIFFTYLAIFKILDEFRLKLGKSLCEK
jgi:hypothetical protein